MFERWMLWASAEGLAKTGEYVAKKFIRGEAGLAGTFWVVLATGLIQTVGGFIGAKSRGATLLAGWRQICGSVILGALMSINSAMGVYAFTYPGADIGIMALLITLSIVPGSFLDWIFFKYALNARQWFGVLLFIASGWAALDFPKLGAVFALPAWVWFGIIIGLVNAINETIAKAIRKADPLVNIFWVGLITITLFSIFLSASGGWRLISSFSGHWWIGSLATGLTIFGLVYFKVMSYKGGGTIALKKMIMQGTRLIAATLLGALLYGEPLTFGKLLAIGIFVVAFAFTDKGTYEFLFKKASATST